MFNSPTSSIGFLRAPATRLQYFSFSPSRHPWQSAVPLSRRDAFEEQLIPWDCEARVFVATMFVFTWRVQGVRNTRYYNNIYFKREKKTSDREKRTIFIFIFFSLFFSRSDVHHSILLIHTIQISTPPESIVRTIITKYYYNNTRNKRFE